MTTTDGIQEKNNTYKTRVPLFLVHTLVFIDYAIKKCSEIALCG